MNRFRQSITHNLRNLANVRGRDDRITFWPYAGTVMALAALGTAALMLPEMLASMVRMQEFAAEHPELATVRSGPGEYSITTEGHHPELMPDMGKMAGAMGAIGVAAVLLLAAAVARRLQDTGRSGLWGLLPLPFLAFASVVMPRLFGAREPDVALFLALFLNNLLYLASLGLLVFFLTQPTRAGLSEQGG